MRIFLNSQQMEQNNLRNQNEITNNGIRPSIKQIEKIIPIKTEDDKDACLRFLTINQDVSTLCHNYYNAEQIKSVIETSDVLIYFVSQANPNNVVTFSLVETINKNKGKIMNILLACAIPNNNKFGKMIAHALQNYAVKKKQPFLQVSPRTPELRKSFVRQGFSRVYGLEGVDEVLQKEIDLILPVFQKRGKTQKIQRTLLD